MLSTHCFTNTIFRPGKLICRLLILLFVVNGCPSFAQKKPYGLTHRIENPAKYFKDIRSTWIGREIEFIKQEKAKSLGKYLGFCLDPADPHHSVIDYANLVGKRGRITDVWKGTVRQSRAMHDVYKQVFFWKIQLNNGETIWYQERGESYIDGIGFMDVLQRARNDIGKAFWAWNISDLYEMNDAATVRLRNLEQVRLTDVRWSEHSNYPLKFIFRASKNKTGYRAYKNVDEFRKEWLHQNPRDQYAGWSALQWLSIENRKLMVGMTPDMVRLAWGVPDAENRVVLPGGKQVFLWIYIGVNKFVEGLFFNSGKLVYWQNKQSRSETQDSLEYNVHQTNLRASCLVTVDWIKQSSNMKNFVTFQW